MMKLRRCGCGNMPEVRNRPYPDIHAEGGYRAAVSVRCFCGMCTCDCEHADEAIEVWNRGVQNREAMVDVTVLGMQWAMEWAGSHGPNEEVEAANAIVTKYIHGGQNERKG